MSKAPAKNDQRKKNTVSDLCLAMDTIAPVGLAQSWDNVGLLLGDPRHSLKRTLLCIDLTTKVLREAIRLNMNAILAYHPPIFKPLNRIVAGTNDMASLVWECARNDISIYATHTALDAAEGGANDVLAAMCGIKHAEPLEYVDQPGQAMCKIITFVPEKAVRAISDAMFTAGAGHIGNYTHCSFSTPGRGSFFGQESTSPHVGKRGKLETVDEVRLETVAPQQKLSAIIAALLRKHPYDEPAFDILPLQPKPVKGIVRIGELLRSTTLKKLATKLKREVKANCVQIVGSPTQKIDRIIVVVGAAGNLPFKTPLRKSDAIITGEIRHHDALAFNRIGCGAIALNHWTSERPILTSLAKRLAEAVPGVKFRISSVDCEPFQPI